MAGTTSNKAKKVSSADTDSVARLRPLLAKRLRNHEFDATLGFLDLIEDRKESVTPATIAMQLPLVSAIYERYWRPAFGRIAKGLSGPSMSAEYETAHMLLKIKHDDTVLDLACGPGNFSRRFARAVAPNGLVVGYDGSRSMLARGVLEARRDETPSLVFVRGEATVLPFETGSFDSVCCFAAIHLFPEPLESLSEMARVLKPGGRIALLTSNASGNGLGILSARAFGAATGIKMFKEDEVRKALEERGFKVETQEAAGATQIVGAVLA